MKKRTPKTRKPLPKGKHQNSSCERKCDPLRSESVLPPSSLISRHQAIERAKLALEAKDWAALLSLAQQPPNAFSDAPEDWLLGWQARLTLFADFGDDLAQMDPDHPRASELRTRLRQYRKTISPQLNEYFAIIFDSLHDYRLVDSAETFLVLRDAAQLTPSSENLVWRLRTHALRLHSATHRYDDLSAEEQAALQIQPSPLETLDIALEQLERFANDNQDTRDLLAIFRIELAMLLSSVDSDENVSRLIACLGEPEPQRIHEVLGHSDAARYRNSLLTPHGWYTLWSLSNNDLSSPAILLREHNRPFDHLLFDGLSDLVFALSQSDTSAEIQFARGLSRLTVFVSDGLQPLGSELCVGTGESVRLVRIPFQDLKGCDFPSAFRGLCESIPATHRFQDRLSAACEILTRQYDFDSLTEAEQRSALLNSKAVQWLCSEIAGFALSCSYAASGSHWAIVFSARGIQEALRRGETTIVDSFYHLEIEDPISKKDFEQAAHALLNCDPNDKGEVAQLQELWDHALGSLVWAGRSSEVAALAVNLARQFPHRLRGLSFKLGYLEQIAGDPCESLRHYLAYILTAEDVSSAVGNMEILANRLNKPEEINQALTMIKETSQTSAHAKALRKLIHVLEKKAGELQEREQWLMTATNRWPGVSMPARKLLGVLHQIKGYRSLDELGSYAGMSAEWVDKHYKKLLKDGMLIDKGDTYDINPYITVLLERENQHSIAARIVRGIGTLAVKPIFNSQREYTIYQVVVQLCPNHLVFPNIGLQGLISYERIKELVSDEDFGYYLRASVDLAIVSSTTYLPMLAIEVDSVWHDTDKQQLRDERKDRIFAAAGIPFMRLRPLGTPSEDVVRGQVAEHLDSLIRQLRTEMPGYDQAKQLLKSLGTPEVKKRGKPHKSH